MKVSPKAPPAQNGIDYPSLSKLYNKLPVGEGAIEMEQVYNVTLVKRALQNRGVVSGKDFRLYNSVGKTYLTRLTSAQMNQE